MAIAEVSKPHPRWYGPGDLLPQDETWLENLAEHERLFGEVEAIMKVRDRDLWNRFSNSLDSLVNTAEAAGRQQQCRVIPQLSVATSWRSPGARSSGTTGRDDRPRGIMGRALKRRGRLMAVRKSVSETVVVDGDREQLLERCKRAMARGGFKNVTANPTLFQVGGTYRKATTSGRLDVTLRPASTGTEIAMRATGNVDNVFALFTSPNQKILRAFKDNL
jgi:hypothetical protein